MLRIGFGVTLALYGAAHYKDFTAFSGMTTAGFTGVLASLATLWAYVLPLLMIVGGLSLAIPYRRDIGAWCGGVALASIAIGMSLKAVLGTQTLMDVGGTVSNTLVWLLIYLFAVKSGSCCCGGAKGAPAGVCTPGGGCC